MEGKGLQIAGFVVSLVSGGIPGAIPGSSVLYIIGGLIGIILSSIGRSQAKQSGGKTGLGTWGIILGIIGIVFGFWWMSVI